MELQYTIACSGEDHHWLRLPQQGFTLSCNETRQSKLLNLNKILRLTVMMPMAHPWVPMRLRPAFFKPRCACLSSKSWNVTRPLASSWAGTTESLRCKPQAVLCIECQDSQVQLSCFSYILNMNHARCQNRCMRPSASTQRQVLRSRQLGRRCGRHGDSFHI